jgi:hypothetical protein
MSDRSGPFWDSVERRIPLPRVAATVGFELAAADPEQGTIEVGFAATDDFTGRIGRRGRLLHRDGDLAFMEATLFDANGEFVATGSATARVIQRSG